MNDSERFWGKVDTSGDCWLWTASRYGQGGRYGQFHFERRPHPAHRVAWRLAHGCWPDEGQVVCHSCDNPLCVRPDHLFVGTQADNMHDMWDKGRGHDGTRVERGAARWNAKLTDEKVRTIRELAASGQPSSVIAERFGVSTVNVRLIVRRKAWAHVA